MATTLENLVFSWRFANSCRCGINALICAIWQVANMYRLYSGIDLSNPVCNKILEIIENNKSKIKYNET